MTVSAILSIISIIYMLVNEPSLRSGLGNPPPLRGSGFQGGGGNTENFGTQSFGPPTKKFLTKLLQPTMSSRKRVYTNQQAVASAGQAFKAPRTVGMPGLYASSSSAPLARVGGRNVLRRMPVPAELKDLTYLNTGLVVAGTTTAVATLINGVAQGTTASTRLGRRINMKSILLRYNFACLPTTAGGDSVRILIVYDAQTNATAPAVTDIVVANSIAQPMNLSNARRFRVILDELVPGFGAQGPPSQQGTRYVKGDWPVEFNTGSAGTVGDITSGAMWMLVWQGGRLITLAPDSNIVTRIRYSD